MHARSGRQKLILAGVLVLAHLLLAGRAVAQEPASGSGLRPLLAGPPETIVPGDTAPLGEPRPGFVEAPAEAMAALEVEPVNFSNWEARVGALILTRSSLSAQPLVYGPGGGHEIDASDFGSPTGGGIDVYVKRAAPDKKLGYDWRFFATAWMENVGPFATPAGSGLAVAGVGSNTFPHNASASFEAFLDNYEFNLRRYLSPNTALQFGIRLVSYDENLHVDFQNAYKTWFWTSNLFIGPQLGVESVLWSRGRLQFTAGAKAAGGVNFAQSDVSFGRRTDDSAAAFVGDINIGADYRFSKHWGLRVGYQMLWLTSLATAAEQLPHMNYSTDTFQTHTGESIFFQGMHIMLEAGW